MSVKLDTKLQDILLLTEALNKLMASAGVDWDVTVEDYVEHDVPKTRFVLEHGGDLFAVYVYCGNAGGRIVLGLQDRPTLPEDHFQKGEHDLAAKKIFNYLETAYVPIKQKGVYYVGLFGKFVEVADAVRQRYGVAGLEYLVETDLKYIGETDVKLVMMITISPTSKVVFEIINDDGHFILDLKAKNDIEETTTHISRYRDDQIDGIAAAIIEHADAMYLN